MSASVARLEWRTALARRRLLVWNLLVPLLLLAPVALSPAAAAHRAAVYAVFFVFFGTFGSAIPLIRDGRNGWTEKLLLTGYGSRRWLLERLVAGSSIDLVQLVPAVALVVAVPAAGMGGPGEGGGLRATVAVLAALALALLFANLLGALVAVIVRSLAEGALGCAVVALFGLHFAGAFRSATPGTWGGLVQTASPFRPLVEATRSLAATGSEPPVGIWAWPVAIAVAALVLVVLVAPGIAHRLSAAEF